MQEAFVRTGEEDTLDDEAEHLCGFPRVRERGR
jgi:hypothetical protein